MQLFTEVIVDKSVKKIDYKTPLMFIGSCFAQNISNFFVNAKFNCNVNPAGIIYNPLSISNLIENIVENKIYNQNDFFFDGENYNCYDFHGSFSNKNVENAVENVNKSLKYAGEFLKTAEFCFITLGTSFVYYLKENCRAVSNCHKQKPDLFFRKRLEIYEVCDCLKKIVENIKKINKNIQIVFTVSPIRHWKDGAHGNRISKALLHLGVENIMEQYPDIQYFPSYEIVEDQLRDYRFYAEDMIHLGPLAEKIIWEKLSDTFISEDTKLQIKRVEKFMLSVNHKIIYLKSPKTKEFAKKNIEIAATLEREISGLDLSEEKKYFSYLIEN